MRVLVTGGAGFIGSHLVEALLDRGDAVVCLDNLDDFYDPAIKQRNIESLRGRPGFEFVRGDIRDMGQLEALAASHSFDAVAHLAAMAGVRPSIEAPALYTEVNLGGTSNLLELARRHSIRNFVFASSSSVYGERTEVPFRETDVVDHPVSPYAASKKGCELLCYTYHHLFGMDVCCLRFFTVYGPRRRPEMMIHKFVRQIQAGEPLTLYGDGSARRDFTYVDDVVRGVVTALDRNRGYLVCNLGNNRMVTLQEAVDLIGKALDKEPKIHRLPVQPGDVSTTCADISRAQRELSYEPSTPFEAGLTKFVDWYQEAVLSP